MAANQDNPSANFLRTPMIGVLSTIRALADHLSLHSLTVAMSPSPMQMASAQICSRLTQVTCLTQSWVIPSATIAAASSQRSSIASIQPRLPCDATHRPVLPASSISTCAFWALPSTAARTIKSSLWTRSIIRGSTKGHFIVRAQSKNSAS